MRPRHEIGPEVLGQPDILTYVNEEVVEDFTRLMSQLKQAEMDPETIEWNLDRAIDSPNTRVMVVRDDSGRVQSTATGIMEFAPTGARGRIEDVVTDARFEGRGYGRANIEALHKMFRCGYALSSNLTSQPHRVRAGMLYESLGYQIKPTRVYRLALGLGRLLSNE